MNDLTGMVALVTGAARGVGATIARRLVEASATVIVTDVLHEQGRAAAADLGDRARYQPLDVTSEEDWDQVVGSVVADHGRLDVLINNAAILHLGTVASTPPETFRRVLEVNTIGPFLGTRAVVGPMKAAGRGSIVHVASIDGLVGMNGVSAYAASKFGLRGLAKSTALELGRDGIRVNCVCPAGGNPEMYGQWMQEMTPFLDETLAYLDDRAIPGMIPFEAIADAVVFLASDAASHITGADLPVDGGATAGKWLPGFNSF